MPITYSCDTCGVSAETLVGWLVVTIYFQHHQADIDPSLVFDSALPQRLFHDEACRDAWRAKVGI